jgi:putative oxidoreductase
VPPLAGFTLLAGAIFHTNFGEQVQTIRFMKSLAIAGGLLLVAIPGAGALHPG